MSDAFTGYTNILAASDFSSHSDRAIRQAAWLAQHSSKRLVVAHVVADLRKAIHHTSYRSRIEFLEGNEDHFQRELRRDADEKLKKQIAALGATGIDIKYETLLGTPYEELIHSVQQEGYDLLIAGTRGHSALGSLVLGSTAKRLVHNCPASVWIVKNERIGPPKSILVAVDFSDASRRALNQAIWTAKQAAASLHVLHVIESTGLHADLLDRKVAGPAAKSLRELIQEEVSQQFRDFVAAADTAGVQIATQLNWGTPAQETVRVAAAVQADLLVLGTVGRRGVSSLLLGNTAETVLTHCNCDVLTVKPADFVSPVLAPAWQLHPGPEQK